MRVDEKTEASVKQALDVFVESYRTHDLQKLRTLFGNEPDVLIYGDGSSERRGLSSLEEHVRKEWAASEQVSLDIEWTSISGSEDAVWVAADGKFAARVGNDDVISPMRMTLVMIRGASRWKIVQLHLSFPGVDEGRAVQQKNL